VFATATYGTAGGGFTLDFVRPIAWSDTTPTPNVTGSPSSIAVRKVEIRSNGLGFGDHHCRAGVLCVSATHQGRKLPDWGMKQDKISIHGPKDDGTYIVEFKEANGVALAFSIPRGGETAILEYFQEKMPYGLAVPDVHGPFQEPFTGQKPFSKRPDATSTVGHVATQCGPKSQNVSE
jgi:hypothetical protein